MKKITTVLLAAVLLFTTSATAQNEKFTKRMTQLIAQMDTARTPNQWQEVGTAFERVAETEKTQWLPFYYAALSNCNQATMQLTNIEGGATDITDPAADKAEALLTKALALTKESSETLIVTKMIASLRMMGDPMSRFMQYGPIAAKALATAKAMDVNNPRIYLLEAQDKFYTPEQFGGSKTAAKKLFTKAAELSKAFKPETALHPNWGMGTINYFLNTQFKGN